MEVKTMADEKTTKRPAPISRVHPDTIFGGTPQPTQLVLEADLAEPQEKMATGIVAAGHSVHQNIGERIQCGYDAVLARPVFRQAFVVVGPGEEVTLPVSEIRRLMEVGILLNPERIVDLTTH
jgi:hypothetical protein